MINVLQAGLKAVLVGLLTLWKGLFSQYRARDETNTFKTVKMKDLTWQEIVEAYNWLESSKKGTKDEGGRLAIITASRNKPKGVITAGKTRPGKRRKPTKDHSFHDMSHCLYEDIDKIDEYQDRLYDNALFQDGAEMS